MFSIQNMLEEYSSKNFRLNHDMFLYLKIYQNWNKIMGDTLSKICAPAFFKNNVLTVTVSDSAWANELMMKRVAIFKNIQKEINITVNELRTRIGDITTEIKEEKNVESYITDEDMKWIDKVVSESNIEDEKMQKLFSSLLRNVVKNR